VQRSCDHTPESAMTAATLPTVLSTNFAVVQEGRGQPGIALTLHLLLRGADGVESSFFLQLAPSDIWTLGDACASLAAACPDRHAAFMAKTQASHQLNYGDRFLKTLPAGDPYAQFHRRRHELAIPVAFRTALHGHNLGVPNDLAQMRNGLRLRFALADGESFACLMPHDLVFLLADTIDQAVWAAEWQRDGQPDEAGS
jgi:hypothetical protein